MTEDKTANPTPFWPGNPHAQHPCEIPDHQMLRLIGSGSYGHVWLARNVMGYFRAVKAVHRDRFPDGKPCDREFEGIRHFEPVSHFPSQVNISHVGRNDRDGYFYYVTRCPPARTPMVDDFNPAYSTLDGVLFDKLQTTLLQYPGGKASSYTVPNSITHIGDVAFGGCTTLTACTIRTAGTNLRIILRVANDNASQRRVVHQNRGALEPV